MKLRKNEKGDYNISLLLNGNRKNYKFYMNIEQYEEKLNQLKSKLYKYLDIILGNLEIYAD